MSPRTLFLSKLIGFYTVLMALAMASHRQDTLATIHAIIHSPPLMFVLGSLTLTAGIALVLGHNVWAGGVLPVLVTLVGWVSVAKGLLFLFLTPQGAIDFYEGLHYDRLFYLYIAIALALTGLTCGGFLSGRSRGTTYRLVESRV